MKKNLNGNTKKVFNILTALFLVASLVAIDQVIKFLVVEYLKPIKTMDFIKGFIRFRYVENSGAAFGSFSDYTVILTVVSIIFLCITIYYLLSQKNKSKLVTISLLLMISGGIGNIADRIRLQYVIDYIEPLFVDFAVFNFADSLITVGAFVLIIRLIYDIVKDVENEQHSEENTFLTDETVSEDGNN